MKDRSTKDPFLPSLVIGNAVHSLALMKGVALYPGTGTADGILGDHVLIAPPYTVTFEKIDELVSVFGDVVNEVFSST